MTPEGGAPPASASPAQLAEDIKALRWWHTLELAPGLLTPGAMDLRRAARRIPWPDLAGARCLDVATMDGFWAFEMERRGAAEVLATDLTDPALHDTPRALRRPPPPAGPSPVTGPRPTFELAARALGSRVAYRESSLYDLRPEDIGRFDLVFVGYVLFILRDPFRALEAVRSVCRGAVIIFDLVSFPLSVLHPRTPLATVAARRGFSDWFVFNTAGLRRAVEAAGFAVEATSPWLRYGKGAGGRWSDISFSDILAHTVGWKGCSRAVRGRVRESAAPEAEHERRGS